jgi:hypothetical protein
VEKFEMFDKTNPKALAELQKYLTNFEVLQTAFGEVEELTLDEPSLLEDIQDEIDQVNIHLQSAYEMTKSAVRPREELVAKLVAEELKIDSVIMNLKQKKDLSDLYPRVTSWSLLYRGSRDGLTSQLIHEKCDDKGPTITVVKAPDGHILGGYLSVDWRNKRYINDPEASIFTLTSPSLGASKQRIPSKNAHIAAYFSMGWIVNFGRCEIGIREVEEGRYNFYASDDAYGEFAGQATSRVHLATPCNQSDIEVEVYAVSEDGKPSKLPEVQCDSDDEYQNYTLRDSLGRRKSCHY